MLDFILFRLRFKYKMEKQIVSTSTSAARHSQDPLAGGCSPAAGSPVPAVRTARPSTVREVNRAIVLNLIRLHQPVSRAELSRRTGIVRSNVSDIVEELVGGGFVVERRARPAGRGRVPTLLSLNGAGLHVIGVSVRPERTQVALSGMMGEVQDSVHFETPLTPAKFPARLLEAVERLRLLNPIIASHRLEAFGISVPGFANSATGDTRWLPALPRYSDYPLAREVSRRCGAPVLIENDCNLAALAEMWLNEAEVAALADFVFIEIGGVGVGGGIVIGRELYRGSDATAVAEFGHMIVAPDGRECSCGRRGCWERYVSDEVTWHRYAPGAAFNVSQFDAFLDAAAQGDRRAARAIRETARYFWVGVSNIAFALNPQVIIVAGAITRVWNLIRDCRDSSMIGGHLRAQVRPSRLSAGELFLRGAIHLALSGVFARPRLG